MQGSDSSPRPDALQPRHACVDADEQEVDPNTCPGREKSCDRTLSDFYLVQAKRKRKTSLYRQRCWMAATIALAAVTGNLALEKTFWKPTIASLAVLASSSLYVRSAGMTFGQSGLTHPQLRREALMSLVYLAAGLPWSTFPCLFGNSVPLDAFLFVLSSLVYLALARSFTARTLGASAATVCALKGILGFTTDVNEEILRHQPWICLCQAWNLLLVCFVRYRKEQVTLCTLATLTLSASYGGSQLFTAPSRALLMLLIIPWLIYLNSLWNRRRRMLPPGLRGCQFVKLTFLRSLVASGNGIRRCQDLPSEAFGDPAKAKFLLAVSHRWLHRLTCDIKTSEHPEGFRLRQMVDHLERHFSEQNFLSGWKTGGIREVWERLGMSLTGGEDVLVFFDFMCLPQDGQRSDGTTIVRTLEEERCFRRCLPQMGALYSMLPVLVCEEVVKGTHSYETSGWCFAEAATAWLGHQLAPFSLKSRILQWFQRWDCNLRDSDGLVEKLDRELDAKHFLNESDRLAVRLIIRGYVVKRRLVEAIRMKNTDLLRDILSQVTERWQVLLDQPVDANLNTPLHLAVAHGFPEGVLLLMEVGANPNLRNLRGDKPAQFLAFPRLSKAARICRRAKPAQRCADHFMEDTLFNNSLCPECSYKISCDETETAVEEQSGHWDSTGNASRAIESMAVGPRQIISLDYDGVPSKMSI